MARVLGLVTARGGSKGVPRKNLRPVAGRPLIAWTLDAAKASRTLTQVMVSTDDPEIAMVARGMGVDVPFLRPAELSGDLSPHLDVVLHALDWLEAHRGATFEYVCLLQPTSPLRSGQDIDAAVERAVSRRAEAVVGITESPVQPHLIHALNSDDTLTPLLPQAAGYVRRQDVPPAYVLNGVIYVNRVESLRRDRTFMPTGTLGYRMPAERSMDVDTEADLRAAEAALAARSVEATHR